jgi:hypothetical protein
MFTPKPRDEIGLELVLVDLFEEMIQGRCDSEEYAKMAEQASKLYSLKEHNSKRRVSPDTMALVLGNLFGIVLIVRHERMNVVTSKALSFILKLR